MRPTLVGLLLVACASPEASRVRDGGPGADPGNKVLRTAELPDPRAADTTLWPGRFPAPVERLAAGTMPLPASIASPAATAAPATPDVRAAPAEQKTLDRSKTADPERPGTPATPPPR